MTSKASLPTYEWYLTAPSYLLEPITAFLKIWLDLVPYIGALQEQANRIVLGKKLGPTVTLKILALSSGAAIKVKRMLLLMNFEEESTSRTCSDGLTSICATLKLKIPAHLSKPRSIGSRRTSTHGNGTSLQV